MKMTTKNSRPIKPDLLEDYQSMLNASIDCIKILSVDGKIKTMNQSGCLALGVDPNSNFGMDWLPLLPKEVQRDGHKALLKARVGENSQFMGKSVSAQGEVMFWNNLLTPVFDEKNEIDSILCVSRDVTRETLAELRLRRSNEFDDLTDIPNRRHFRDYLKKTIKLAKKSPQPVTLLHANLDYFKLLNDTRGHQFGDHILKIVAKRLTKYLAGQGYVARLSGDEFAIIIQQDLSFDEVNAYANDLISTVTKPITHLGITLKISMSIGAATWPHQVENSEKLVMAADIALAERKKNGRGGVHQFHAEMLSSITKVSQQIELADFAISAKTISPYYQPKVSLQDGSIVGLEALLRFTDPEGKLAYPNAIWAAFENHSLVEKIGEQIREKVFTDINAWLDKGLTVVPVSINASPVEFMLDNYAENFLAQLSAYNIAPQLIEVEITEHMMVGHSAAFVIRAIDLLRANGVRIALDDFGTGYSALSNIKDYAVDIIKVDRSFVSCLSQGNEGKAIIKALFLLADCLGMDVIAEGVEQQQQCDALLNEGYLIGQGYLFSPAVDNQHMEKFLAAKTTTINR